MAATHLYSGFDYLVSLATLFGVSMPVYWLGLILIIVFAVQLNWLRRLAPTSLGVLCCRP